MKCMICGQDIKKLDVGISNEEFLDNAGNVEISFGYGSSGFDGESYTGFIHDECFKKIKEHCYLNYDLFASIKKKEN